MTSVRFQVIECAEFSSTFLALNVSFVLVNFQMRFLKITQFNEYFFAYSTAVLSEKFSEMGLNVTLEVS